RYIRRSKDKVTGNLSRGPLRKNCTRQVGLSEVVEAENTLIFVFWSGGKWMQFGPPSMAEHRIQTRKTIKRLLHHSIQRSGIGDVGGEIDTRRIRNLPLAKRFPGLFLTFDIDEDKTCSGGNEPSSNVLGNRA